MRKFTLIELLIVIAVFGILISILLPSLLRSREKAKRAVCLSNLKQNYTYFTVFSNDQNQKIPFLHSGHKQFNYTIYNKDQKKFWGFGTLLREGYLDTPENIMYCPSRKLNIWITFNGSNNRWPIRRKKHTRAGYSYRAIMHTNDILNFADNYDNNIYKGYPSILKFESTQALLSDSMTASHSDSHFYQGNNVIKADGSGGWKSRKQKWGTLLNAIPTGGHRSSYNSLIDLVWSALDD